MSSAAELKVLVVDDESAIRESLVEFLNDMGMAATGTEGAEQALVLVSGQHFDVAIVDLRLPGMGGETLIFELEQRHPDTRFLIHTGTRGYEPPPELERIGVRSEHVYHKPLADLSQLVNGVLALKCAKT